MRDAWTVSEPTTWSEICERFPAQWVALVALDWRDDEPRRVRYAVAADAITLLADPARIARLHRCPGRDCGWIFLDTSGRRRWCSMQTCGSREKMRRMYERKRAERLAHD